MESKKKDVMSQGEEGHIAREFGREPGKKQSRYTHQPIEAKELPF